MLVLNIKIYVEFILYLFEIPLVDPLTLTIILSFFLGKLTYVLKEEDTNIIRGIPQI